MMGEVAGVGGIFIVIFAGTYIIQAAIWIIVFLGGAVRTVVQTVAWAACFLISPSKALAALGQAKAAAPDPKGYQPLDWPIDPALYD